MERKGPIQKQEGNTGKTDLNPWRVREREDSEMMLKCCLHSRQQRPSHHSSCTNVTMKGTMKGSRLDTPGQNKDSVNISDMPKAS